MSRPILNDDGSLRRPASGDSCIHTNLAGFLGRGILRESLDARNGTQGRLKQGPKGDESSQGMAEIHHADKGNAEETGVQSAAERDAQGGE